MSKMRKHSLSMQKGGDSLFGTKVVRMWSVKLALRREIEKTLKKVKL